MCIRDRVAHVEGKNCVAGGNCTHAQNLGTIAEKDNCTALGKYNKDLGYAVMIGGGSSDTDRKNILIVAWDGTVRTTGGVDAGGNISGINGTFGGKLSVLGDANFYGKTNFKVPIATKNAVGGIKVGENLSKSEDGTLSASGGNSYVLPSATADTLGGVKIGDNISVTADGVISVDMSEYLKNADIADWAKAESKPVYTASEVGLGNVDNTADIDKPVSTATQMALDSKDYLKATEITGQTIDLNDITLNTASDKGKSQRYFCASASAQNISNRPVSANEPFELTVDNIRYVNADAFNSVQRYTSVTRKRSYTRWCDDNIWRAWMCDTDIVIYGTVTSELPKSFDYATYGEGYNQVEIEPYYDNNASPIRNRIVLTLTSATFYDRDVLTVGDSVEHLKIENGTVMMSLTGTKTLSFMIKYTNKRA